MRRLSEFFDASPADITQPQIEAYFDSLIRTHSWSTIDSARMKVHVRRGKGKKDRFVTLPQRPQEAMRRYWKTHRHPQWIFPNGRTAEERRVATPNMDRGGVQKSLKAITQSCGIHKHVTPHTSRHCYGALLLEAGVKLGAIQEQMGHECPKTTGDCDAPPTPLRPG